ncbi:hypothetical protein ACOMHN_008195 [Nucella lapillus]
MLSLRCLSPDHQSTDGSRYIYSVNRTLCCHYVVCPQITKALMAHDTSTRYFPYQYKVSDMFRYSGVSVVSVQVCMGSGGLSAGLYGGQEASVQACMGVRRAGSVSLSSCSVTNAARNTTAL